MCLCQEIDDPGAEFNEAVNFGIAIYNMRQGEGIRFETLFRDETVGALDATNANEYRLALRTHSRGNCDVTVRRARRATYHSGDSKRITRGHAQFQL